MGPAATTVALRRAVRVERGQLTDHLTGTDDHLVVGEVHLGLALEEEERLGAALALRRTARRRRRGGAGCRPADRRRRRRAGSRGPRGGGRPGRSVEGAWGQGAIARTEREANRPYRLQMGAIGRVSGSLDRVRLGRRPPDPRRGRSARRSDSAGEGEPARCGAARCGAAGSRCRRHRGSGRATPRAARRWRRRSRRPVRRTPGSSTPEPRQAPCTWAVTRSATASMARPALCRIRTRCAVAGSGREPNSSRSPPAQNAGPSPRRWTSVIESSSDASWKASTS